MGSTHVRIPDRIVEQAEKLKEQRDFASRGEAIRHMCQEGGYDV
jgi:Arc/MetJ-type ribon-helix-helix transcriptional regulator